MFTTTIVSCVATIAVATTGANPTKVDSNAVAGLATIAMYIGACVWFISVLCVDMYKERKATKIRKAKETERLTLRNKYSNLSNGLTTWLDDALLQVKWCEYSSDFQINYEHPLKRLCVRCHIGTDGYRKDFYTIGGYKCDFLNECDKDAFDNALHTLIGRIEDTNAGILFESK